MENPESRPACDKGPRQCRDGDKPADTAPPPALPVWARLPINRCNLPAQILGSLTFQASPSPLFLDGVHDLHRDFFRMLGWLDDAPARRQTFHDYMRLCFRLDALEEAGLAAGQAHGRGRMDYLRLLRGWHFNADGIEGAVLKAWVESRFGLLPRHHRAPIRDFSGEPYRLYLEQRATGLYNTNALESQLDLVYSWTQLELARRHPQASHCLLYRGINRWEAHEILGSRRGEHGSETLMLLNNLSAFSADPERAGEFGDRVVRARVPLAKILCSAEVLPGQLQGEGEALVIGGVYALQRL
ncbi:MAG: NAD(+)--dinitrogen-reductase ADP-D-ribosyltransferase [Candidatus Dactylopiibacterium sp.]|nr:NAD(+)--dinitrogen-reductase ADP-D-ribosyltransferase [Candidatus Dactylopiibacterium sp.]